MESLNKDIIYFFNKENEICKREHIFLNNFHSSSFVADDNFRYPTVEHYYQCHKFDNWQDVPEFKEKFEEIRNAKSAFRCKQIARKYERKYSGRWQVDKWHNQYYKDCIMKRALVFKFSQNIILLEKLLLTADKKIVEASPFDPYWGGILPDSKNKLGEFIMILRDNYKKDKLIFIEGSGLEKMASVIDYFSSKKKKYSNKAKK